MWSWAVTRRLSFMYLYISDLSTPRLASFRSELFFFFLSSTLVPPVPPLLCSDHDTLNFFLYLLHSSFNCMTLPFPTMPFPRFYGLDREFIPSPVNGIPSQASRGALPPTR
ncbi:unnamed protein product [Tuber aestivum]|uniref:Uncharacterized protein n=1 Tax=Tuber aestivum TaxID=59557 RepID=A0A292Q8P1_9PEZI|nr:unnamed protein product [Tuber aestivum]